MKLHSTSATAVVQSRVRRAVADVVFTLPTVARTATVDPSLMHWVEPLERLGVKVSNGASDLLVISPSKVARGPLTEHQFVVVDGPIRSQLKSHRVLLPLPREGPPTMLVAGDQRRATSFALVRRLSARSRAGEARNRAAAALASVGLLPALGGRLTTWTRGNDIPGLVSAASDVVGTPAEQIGWYLHLARRAQSHNVFVLFGAASRRPSSALKFRRHGESSALSREAKGLALLARSSPEVATRAPKDLGRFTLDGIEALLLTAVNGSPLVNLLTGPADRKDKLVRMERVVEWLLRLADDTAQRGALASTSASLADELLPRWASEGLDAKMFQRVSKLPGVLGHGDMWEENVLVDARDFWVIDWEWASEASPPLWDLMTFGLRALGLIDGMRSAIERDHYCDRLLGGVAPASEVFFGWLRRGTEALDLDDSAVGDLATLLFLHRATHRVDAKEPAKPSSEPGLFEGLATRWLNDPSLRESFDRRLAATHP